MSDEKSPDGEDMLTPTGIAEAAFRKSRRHVPEGMSDATLAQGPWISDLVLTRSGSVRASIDNVATILARDSRWRAVLTYCEFSYRLIKHHPPPWAEPKTGEWEDADTAKLRIWLSREYGITPSAADVADAVLVTCDANRSHPVREYLEPLRWDGEKRLALWLPDFLGTPNSDYEQAVGSKWMVAAVARVMSPPCKADCVLILEGDQGIGKSTALAILGGPWFSDSHFVIGDKDGYQQLHGLWICELAELDAFNKAESTRAKLFFGSMVDRFRRSYGRNVSGFARQCVFAGTTNHGNYLKDPTGNRRYWPVRCTGVELEALRQARDQLWAEAVHLYRQGTPWWPTPSEQHLFESEQDARYQVDAWEELVSAWLDEPEQRMSDQYTGAAIMSGALHMEPHQMRPPEQTRLGIVMTRLGWDKRRERFQAKDGSHQRRYLYIRPVKPGPDKVA